MPQIFQIRSRCIASIGSPKPETSALYALIDRVVGNIQLSRDFFRSHVPGHQTHCFNLLIGQP